MCRILVSSKISTSNDQIIVKEALLCDHLGQKNYAGKLKHYTFEHHPENTSLHQKIW